MEHWNGNCSGELIIKIVGSSMEFTFQAPQLPEVVAKKIKKASRNDCCVEHKK